MLRHVKYIIANAEDMQDAEKFEKLWRFDKGSRIYPREKPAPLSGYRSGGSNYSK